MVASMMEMSAFGMQHTLWRGLGCKSAKLGLGSLEIRLAWLITLMMLHVAGFLPPHLPCTYLDSIVGIYSLLENVICTIKICLCPLRLLLMHPPSHQYPTHANKDNRSWQQPNRSTITHMVRRAKLGLIYLGTDNTHQLGTGLDSSVHNIQVDYSGWETYIGNPNRNSSRCSSFSGSNSFYNCYKTLFLENGEVR